MHKKLRNRSLLLQKNTVLQSIALTSLASKRVSLEAHIYLGSTNISEYLPDYLVSTENCYWNERVYHRKKSFFFQDAN